MSRCAHCYRDNATTLITGGTTYQAQACPGCRTPIRREASRAGPVHETPISDHQEQPQLF